MTAHSRSRMNLITHCEHLHGLLRDQYDSRPSWARDVRTTLHEANGRVVVTVKGRRHAAWVARAVAAAGYERLYRVRQAFAAASERETTFTASEYEPFSRDRVGERARAGGGG